VVFTFPTFGGFLVLLQCRPRIFSNNAFQGFYNFLQKVGMDVIVIVVIVIIIITIIIIIRLRRANQWWLRVAAQPPRPKFHHALQVALQPPNLNEKSHLVTALTGADSCKTEDQKHGLATRRTAFQIPGRTAFQEPPLRTKAEIICGLSAPLGSELFHWAMAPMLA
jgi:hypothetical protein